MSVFLVASFVPVWSPLCIGPLEITGESATFWQMLASLWEAVRQPVQGQRLAEHFGTEALKAAVLLTLSVVLGRVFAGNPDPPEAADYDDQ
jgi:hypothetical protein